MTRLAPLSNTKQKFCACIKHCVQEYSTYDTNMLKICKYVFQILFHNLDVVAKNRCGWWIGDKILINIGLNVKITDYVALAYSY